ncbi:HNH endonuclease signature motif containing protein [Mycolicibacterium sp. jd]|uniref:HNH endonuclease signature motif containing protein n=2 Tax=Mycolicibacterium TaxID=1866885 RepID=UPI00351B2E9F
MSLRVPVGTGTGGVVRQSDRLDAFFEELAELAGQRNAIDGRIAEIAAEIDGAELWAITGVKSLEGLLAWKLGTSFRNAETIVAVARRLEQFPRCSRDLREGRLSLDQVGVIAERAGAGSDDHYADLAAHSTVAQLRTAVKQEPRPEPEPDPESESGADCDPESESEAKPRRDPVPRASITKTSDEQYTYWRIALPHEEAATFDTALNCHLEGLVAQWKRDHNITDHTDDHNHDINSDPGRGDGHDTVDRGYDTDDGGGGGGGGEGVGRAPLPDTVAAFWALVKAGWDVEVARRPHGAHTTVVMHVDVKDRISALHLGPALSAAERRYLSCDATCEVWFERHGQVIGSGRTTRAISRRLRRALEHRDRTCVVPGCGATRGLHAHHIRHWEDGGLTELDNLVLVCPHHHRLHHRGVITITGPADQLTVTDSVGRHLEPGSLARPPTQSPPEVAPYQGPPGERAQWKWYTPFQPPPPTTN